MASALPDDSLELLQLYDELPADDRARILSLVRSLTICHAAQALYNMVPFAKGAAQGSGMVSMSEPVCDPCA